MALQKNLGNAAVSGDVESTDNKLGGSNFYQVTEISVGLQGTAGWRALVRTRSVLWEEAQS